MEGGTKGGGEETLFTDGPSEERRVIIVSLYLHQEEEDYLPMTSEDIRRI